MTEMCIIVFFSSTLECQVAGRRDRDVPGRINRSKRLECVAMSKLRKGSATICGERNIIRTRNGDITA